MAIIAIAALTGLTALATASKTSDVKSWEKALRATEYDRFSTPNQAEGRTTNVAIEIYVESIGNYRASTMDYDLDIYFIQHWKDPRLHNSNQQGLSINDVGLITSLWVPDLYFANSKSARYNEVTVPNKNMFISSDGTIRYSARISLKASCQMDLKAYPLDKQLCTLKLLPYGNSNDLVNVTWAYPPPKKSVTVDPNIMQADLRLIEVTTVYCRGEYFGKNYSCLNTEFHLQRDIGSSLLQTYFPTTFIVIISFISFWIDPSSVPGRVALAVTTLLTLATQAAGIRYTLPPVSYAKALDIWLGLCMLFLFGVLLEFAIVNMYERQANAIASRKKKHDEDNEDDYDDDDTNEAYADANENLLNVYQQQNEDEVEAENDGVINDEDNFTDRHQILQSNSVEEDVGCEQQPEKAGKPLSTPSSLMMISNGNNDQDVESSNNLHLRNIISNPDAATEENQKQHRRQKVCRPSSNFNRPHGPSGRERGFNNNGKRGCCRGRILLDESYYRKRAADVDRVSRAAFPIVFVIFALIYWLVYKLDY